MAKPTISTMLHPTRAALLRGSKQSPGGGITTYISWSRLAAMLKTSEEEVSALVIEDEGISVYLERKR